MSYIEIIILGYIINIFCYIFTSIFYAIIFLKKENVVNTTILAKNIDLIKAKRKFLSINKVNPYRQKDFLSWIPFMGGLHMLNIFAKGSLSNHFVYLNDLLINDIEYLNGLIKLNKLDK